MDKSGINVDIAAQLAHCEACGTSRRDGPAPLSPENRNLHEGPGQTADLCGDCVGPRAEEVNTFGGSH